MPQHLSCRCKNTNFRNKNHFGEKIHREQFAKFAKFADFTLDKSPEVAQLDFDKLKFPLTVRHWRHGDRFHPLGLKGSKLLSDFFVDQKFTDYQKQNVWLLVSADNAIVWVVGHRIDERFKTTSETKIIFRCRLIS